MKISKSSADLGVTGTSPVGENVAGSAQTPTKAASSSASATESDKVTLSSLSGSDNDASGLVDVAKVSSVRQSIENGSYKVNPEVIADKLISNAKELMRSPSA